MEDFIEIIFYVVILVLSGIGSLVKNKKKNQTQNPQPSTESHEAFDEQPASYDGEDEENELTAEEKQEKWDEVIESLILTGIVSKKDADAKAILAYLYKNTDLETSFGINMVAIADGKPMQMGLKAIIGHYIRHHNHHRYSCLLPCFQTSNRWHNQPRLPMGLPP